MHFRFAMSTCAFSTVAFLSSLLPGFGVPTVLAQNADATNARSPLMKQLKRFSDPNVPQLGPEETEAAPLQADQSIPNNLPGKGLAQHPMLYLGEGYNKLLVIDKGKVIWTYSTGTGWEYDDAWMLSNGNILFSRMQYVAEVTPRKEIVWRWDAPAGTEIHTCQPIGLDKVLFIVNGLPPKLMVVDIKSKKIEVEHELSAPSKTGMVHGQFRRVRYTSQGTYLIPFLEMDKIVEYDKDFREVWSYDIKSPWAAVRLPNGNTLITDEKENLTREVTPQKQTVWELSPNELPEAYRYNGSQSATRLANGNTILCSRGNNGTGPQLVEVTPDKKVVWVLQDWSHVGPATGVQILDDPGKPEVPGISLH